MIRNGFGASPADHPWPSMADPRTIGKWVGGAGPASAPAPEVPVEFIPEPGAS